MNRHAMVDKISSSLENIESLCNSFESSNQIQCLKSIRMTLIYCLIELLNENKID